MTGEIASYRESLYQWVWEHLEFDVQGLKTGCGKKITIIRPGGLNKGAGPDFLNAHIRVDNMDWFGSIEIHKAGGDWYRHNHNTDPNFNSVILHVVFEGNNLSSVVTENGSEPYTLYLTPHLNKHLQRLFNDQRKSKLPCGGNLTFINQEAFSRQIRQVHREYFETKITQVLEHYDAGLIPSEAWKKSLLINIYKNLGIPRNREQMVCLADKTVNISVNKFQLREFTHLVEQKAFETQGHSKIDWKNSGMRPASRPRVRIKQAAALHFSISKIPFHAFLKNGTGSWDHITSGIPKESLPGASRLSIIRHTAFLPSVYLLGDLFHSKKLKKSAFIEWEKSGQKVPEEVIAPFTKAGFKVGKEQKLMGLAHQYKRYCMKKNCHRCKVFKNAIRS